MPITLPKSGLVYQILSGKGSPHQFGGGQAAREAACRMSLQALVVEKCSRHMVKLLLDAMPRRPLHYLVYRGGIITRSTPHRGGPGVTVGGGSAMPTDAVENCVVLKREGGFDEANLLDEALSREILEQALLRGGLPSGMLQIVQQVAGVSFHVCKEKMIPRRERCTHPGLQKVDDVGAPDRAGAEAVAVVPRARV
jgi:hypothetical protein